MRTASIERNTKETQIKLELNLDGTGKSDVVTGIGFFDHMLDQIAKHGLVDLKIQATGDLKVDGHHTVEDVGIALGQALSEAAGDKRGFVRYGYSYVPLDEALSRVVLDYSGRAGLSFNVQFAQAQIGELDSALIKEFFQAVANNAKMTIHVDNIRGDNAHHQAETVFKAFGRALRMASAIDERARDTIPSTKGSL